jgi:hypothetical protein
MIDLKDLRHLIVGEINKAEKQVIKDVHLSLGNAKEDEITTLFVVGAERGLMEATESGRVAAAVRSDIERGYWAAGHSPPRRLKHLTDGLVARLRKQQSTEEKETGGDFGLLIVEPQFRLQWDKQLDLYRAGLKRGLLVQAKRRCLDGRWNQFTTNQTEVLPKRLDYTALLRYDFEDYSRKSLHEFNWHLLSGITITELIHWLKSDEFPIPVTTSAIVEGLSKGEFGTDDKEVIEQVICPDAGSYTVIEIDWKEGEEGDNWEGLMVSFDTSAGLCFVSVDCSISVLTLKGEQC